MRDLYCIQVHERTLQGDFLMALLRQLVKQRRAQNKPLKVSLNLGCAHHLWLAACLPCISSVITSWAHLVEMIRFLHFGVGSCNVSGVADS